MQLKEPDGQLNKSPIISLTIGMITGMSLKGTRSYKMMIL